jgi:hypothetical protein
VIPGRDLGDEAKATADPQRRRLTFMVGLWGDSEEDESEESDDEEEEEEEGHAWAPGPMARVPFNDARLTWPGQLGAAGNWGLSSENGDKSQPVTFLSTCDATSGLLVLPRAAWRPVDAPAAPRAEEEGEEEGAMLFSPKATYRFVLRDAGEVGAEMDGLLLAAAAAAMDGGESESESESEEE